MTEAEDQLARLGVQVEAMQSVRVRLLQDAVRAEARLEHADTDARQVDEGAGIFSPRCTAGRARKAASTRSTFGYAPQPTSGPAP